MLDLNLIIGLSLTVLAFCTFSILLVIVSIAFQFYKTLNSAQHLIDTVNDFEPDVKEIKDSIRNVRKIVGKGSNALKGNLDEVNIFLVSSAHGILTGVREYFSSCKSYKTSKNGYNDEIAASNLTNLEKN